MHYSIDSIDKELFFVRNEKDILYNYDNYVLFRHRYYRNTQQNNKRYKKRSLLYKYCERFTTNPISAGRLLCVFGRLGILDVVDVLEAENYIHEIDPKIFPANEFPKAFQKIMIEICDDIKKGITI